MTYLHKLCCVIIYGIFKLCFTRARTISPLVYIYMYILYIYVYSYLVIELCQKTNKIRYNAYDVCRVALELNVLLFNRTKFYELYYIILLYLTYFIILHSDAVLSCRSRPPKYIHIIQYII